MNDKSAIRAKRLSPGLIAGLFVALFFSVSLFIRTYLPYDQVFVGEWVKFTSIDAYIHMRLVDSIVHNFPVLTNFDPYLLYPFGLNIDNIHFFDWLLAGIIWVIGLGSPTQHTIDVVSVYFPAVLAALTVIPVYFIGKELFERWVGVMAAGLIAIMPGEYLGRSILGFTDHHVAETLFTTLTMMFLIMAVKRAQESGLTVRHLRDRDWKVIRKPVIYSAIAGLSLGIYLVTWIGGLLFVFIILLYLFIQFIIDHLKRNSTDYLLPAGTIPFFIAFIIYVLFVGGTFTLESSSVMPWLALLIAAVTPIMLQLISSKYAQKKIRPYYYPVTLLGAGIVLLAIVALVAPAYIRYGFDIFNPFGVRTILEMQPILAPSGQFTLDLIWGNFTTGFFLTVGLLLFWIFYKIAFRRQTGDAGVNLLLIWSLVILLATIGQRRFAYYLAVNVALLSGYLCWQFFKINRDIHPKTIYLNLAVAITALIFLVFYSGIAPVIVALLVALLIAYIFWQFLQALDILKISSPTAEPQIKARRREKAPAGRNFALYYANIAVVIIIIFLLAFSPNLKPTIAVASGARFAPSNAWVGSLAWMKENTPEPFGDPDFYYQTYEPPLPGEGYDYPDSVYAVMAWVDYGYWITRIAHRPVNLTPGPGGFHVARLFLSQDENSSEGIEWHTRWEKATIPESQIIDKMGARYIMLDSQTTTSKIWALINWAKQEMPTYFDTYFLPQKDGNLAPATLFHPEYYRSLAVRLYNFDGQAVTPTETIVIAYEERPFQYGGTVKLVTGYESFPSYEEAEEYLSGQESGHFQIVGDSAFISPVPLEGIKHYKLVYQSPESEAVAGVGNVPAVKIFEYVE